MTERASDALTIVGVSSLALQVGVSMGFNCAMVATWTDSDLHAKLMVRFGDLHVMQHQPLSSTALECARSWTDEVPCVRAQMDVELPECVRWNSAAEFQARLTAELLEVA